ncbi:MAG TPA: hypothetical protein VFT42_00830 [Solirubrobacteraceae bacterium]|nr:hypothetical protein [Solirubrobacteraceae bacterium]
MSTTDYIVNAVIVLLVLRQIRERRLDLRSLVLPLVLIAFAAHAYLHSLPTSGDSVALIAVLAAAGLTLGSLCALATRVRVAEDGVARARAGGAAAALWVAGVGSRLAFVLAASHGAGPAIAHFSAAHRIAPQGWVWGFVLMALGEALARLLILEVRALRATGALRRSQPLVPSV